MAQGRGKKIRGEMYQLASLQKLSLPVTRARDAGICPLICEKQNDSLYLTRASDNCRQLDTQRPFQGGPSCGTAFTFDLAPFRE